MENDSVRYGRTNAPDICSGSDLILFGKERPVEIATYRPDPVTLDLRVQGCLLDA